MAELALERFGRCGEAMRERRKLPDGCVLGLAGELDDQTTKQRDAVIAFGRDDERVR